MIPEDAGSSFDDLQEPRCMVSVAPRQPAEEDMATNKPTGDNARKGAVRSRSQVKSTVDGEERFTKRDSSTGQFIDQKRDEKPFKGVRKEK